MIANETPTLAPKGITVALEKHSKICVLPNKDKNNAQNYRTNNAEQYHLDIEKNSLNNLSISCHKINGLKYNSMKGTEENVDIIDLAETNILSKEGKFILKDNSRYVSFWANTCKNKKK
ncbi:6676_t:CDS:2, partial [Gigaspora margarita]